MTDLQRHIAAESKASATFKAAYDAESTLLALVRARQAAKLTQQDVATALKVSQPYIAQIERGSRPAGLMFLVRYANAVGAKIEVRPA